MKMLFSYFIKIVLPIFITVYFGYKGLNPTVNIEVFSNSSSILSAAKSAKNMKVQFGDEVVTELYLHTISLRNSSDVDFKPEDFDQGFEFTLKPDSTIYDVKINNKYPENLKIELNTINSSVVVNPMLFNANEYFVLDIYTDSPSLPRPSVRLPGQSELQFKEHSKFSLTEVLLLAFCVTVIYTIFFSYNEAMSEWFRVMLSLKVSVAELVAHIAMGLPVHLATLVLILNLRLTDSLSMSLYFSCVFVGGILSWYAQVIYKKKLARTNICVLEQSLAMAKREL